MPRYVKYTKKAYPLVQASNAFAKRARVYTPAVRQLASDVMYLKGLVNSEPKTHVVQATNNVNWAGSVISLCDIPQGDGSNSRDGNMVLPRYLSINLLAGATNTGTTPVVMRYIIFRFWGEATASAATVNPGDILSTTGTQFASFSHLKEENTGSKGDRERRIEILRNEMVSCDLTDVRSFTRSINIVLNGNGKKEHIKFRSASTADPVSGGVYIMFITNDTTSLDAKYTFESKLTFYDN